VRQGPPLARNLRNFLTNRPLKPFRPQASWLALITTGGKHAVLSKGGIAFSGGWLWGFKDYIDRSFMRKFGADLPVPEAHLGMLPHVI
jgi:selenide, water dikinase